MVKQYVSRKANIVEYVVVTWHARDSLVLSRTGLRALVVDDADLEVGHPSVVAPVALAAPAQRLVLGAPDLTRLGVRVALELGLGAAEETPVHVVVLALC